MALLQLWLFTQKRPFELETGNKWSYHSHKSSGKAVLSESKSDLITGFQDSASSGRELKKRLSLKRSATGVLHAFSAAWILVISWSTAKITSSISNGLLSLWTMIFIYPRQSPTLSSPAKPVSQCNRLCWHKYWPFCHCPPKIYGD